MADEIRGGGADGAAAADWDDGREERWPVPYTVMLVAAASVTLWAAIIGGVRWLAG